MKAFLEQRRHEVLKPAVIALMALTFSFAASAQSPKPAATIPPEQATASDQVIHVAYRGSLYEAGQMVELPFGAWSSPLEFRGKGSFLIKVVPMSHPDPRFGPVFTLILATPDGKELGRINLGDRATGTFTDYGLEFTLFFRTLDLTPRKG